MFADEIVRARRAQYRTKRIDQGGAVVVKFFWWPLIISLGLSILLTIILNVIF
jgi:hypothetical protein